MKTYIVKLLSRKLLFCLFSVLSILLSVSQAAYTKLPDSVLTVALPTVVIAITVICVSYVTGQAKIDIAATYGEKK